MNNLAETQEVETQEVETKETAPVADGFEIEVVDDTPEEEKPRLTEDRKPEVPSEDEIETYSVGVQKRINKLKFEAQEQERQKLEATRLQEEALK